METSSQIHRHRCVVSYLHHSTSTTVRAKHFALHFHPITCQQHGMTKKKNRIFRHVVKAKWDIKLSSTLLGVETFEAKNGLILLRSEFACLIYRRVVSDSLFLSLMSPLSGESRVEVPFMTQRQSERERKREMGDTQCELVGTLSARRERKCLFFLRLFDIYPCLGQR